MRRSCLSRWVVTATMILSAFAAASAEEAAFRIVSERSEVAFDATYPLGDFTGTTKDVKGEFRVDPADLARPVTGRLEVNPGSLDTGIAGRDQDLREHLEVKRFPAIVFVPKEVRAGQASLPDRGEIPVTISGLMTIHGVERPVEFSGKARLQEGGLRVEGVTALKMSDYGITRPTKLFFRVGDEVKVRFRVEAANPILGPLP